MPEGHSANQSLSTVEPVSAPPNWKLKNGEQRPAPETRPARSVYQTKRPLFSSLAPPTLSVGEVGIGSAMRFCDAEIGEHQGGGFGLHRAAAIGMQGELAGNGSWL